MNILKLNKKIIDLFVITFSLIFCFKFIQLSGGDLLDKYPYISPDGFDWYIEGGYLYNLLFDSIKTPLNVLRPPVFVLMCFIDYALGKSGYFLGLIFGLSIYTNYFYILKILEIVINKKEYIFINIVVALCCTVIPINFIKPFLLSDSVAITLSLVASYYFLKNTLSFSRLDLFIGSCLSLLGGLTQTYALIPSIVILFSLIINKDSRIFSSIKYYLYSLILILVSYVVVTYAWRFAIPHLATPLNFSLLKLSLGMMGFYISTWSFYFSPFLIYLVIIKRYDFNLNKIYFIGTVSTISLIFSFLTFFYQWPEARFTSYFWFWILILYIAISNFSTIYNKIIFISILFISIAFVPANYWAPTWASTRWNLGGSWYATYFRASPVNRGITSCNEDCSNNSFFVNSDPYIQGSINIYRNFKF
jgi:hypothetical protein